MCTQFCGLTADSDAAEVLTADDFDAYDVCYTPYYMKAISDCWIVESEGVGKYNQDRILDGHEKETHVTTLRVVDLAHRKSFENV